MPARNRSWRDRESVFLRLPVVVRLMGLGRLVVRRRVVMRLVMMGVRGLRRPVMLRWLLGPWRLVRTVAGRIWLVGRAGLGVDELALGGPGVLRRRVARRRFSGLRRRDD